MRIDDNAIPVWLALCLAPRPHPCRPMRPAAQLTACCDAERLRFIACRPSPAECRGSAEAKPHGPLVRAAYANAPVGEPNPVRETLVQTRVSERYEQPRISWKGGLIDILM